MDKYEFKLKVDEMKALVSARNYNAAAEIAETINWRKIRNLNALVLAGEVFEQVERYEESKSILLMAYDKSPIGRNIIYRLAEIAIKTKHFDEAQEYYDEFVDIAPHDNLKFVLKYKMTAAQGLSFKEQIQILEQLKEQEYSEEWAYELAYLYHRDGQPEKCVEACDELILWFGDGIYVEKALELKMHYQPLTKQQEEKYRLFRQKRTGVIEVRPNDFLESGEIVNEAVAIPSVETNTGQYNTANLQEEIARGIQQIASADGEENMSGAVKSIRQLTEDNPYMYGSEEKGQKAARIRKLVKMQQTADLVLGEEAAVPERSMSFEEIQAEWEKTKLAMQNVLKEAQQRELEPEKEKTLEEAEVLMGRLLDIVAQIPDTETSDGVNKEGHYEDTGIDEGSPSQLQSGLDQAGKIVASINKLLQEQIDSLIAEELKNQSYDTHEVSDPTRELPKLPEEYVMSDQGMQAAVEKMKADDEENRDVKNMENQGAVSIMEKLIAEETARSAENPEMKTGISAIELLQRVRLESSGMNPVQKTAAGKQAMDLNQSARAENSAADLDRRGRVQRTVPAENPFAEDEGRVLSGYSVRKNDDRILEGNAETGSENRILSENPQTGTNGQDEFLVSDPVLNAGNPAMEFRQRVSAIDPVMYIKERAAAGNSGITYEERLQSESLNTGYDGRTQSGTLDMGYEGQIRPGVSDIGMGEEERIQAENSKNLNMRYEEQLQTELPKNPNMGYEEQLRVESLKNPTMGYEDQLRTESLKNPNMRYEDQLRTESLENPNMRYEDQLQTESLKNPNMRYEEQIQVESSKNPNMRYEEKIQPENPNMEYGERVQPGTLNMEYEERIQPQASDTGYEERILPEFANAEYGERIQLETLDTGYGERTSAKEYDAGYAERAVGYKMGIFSEDSDQGYEKRILSEDMDQRYEKRILSEDMDQRYEKRILSEDIQAGYEPGVQSEDSGMNLEHLDEYYIAQQKNRQQTEEFSEEDMTLAAQAAGFYKETQQTGIQDDNDLKRLTPEQKNIFSYFVPVSGMEAQIYDLLQGVSEHLRFDKNALSGNIIVEGIGGNGKTVLIMDIIKVLQKEIKRPNGKIGKIDANALNQKDMDVLTEKVSGGCLIIESAGKITRETAVKLSRCMEKDHVGTLYILEDTEQGIQKALERDSSFAAKFTEKISIPLFSIDELVAFGKSYANDLNYDIDEMGILALYKRIGNIQKLDHMTTLTEVKEIVDEAIDNAEKGVFKKVFGILTATRANDDNYVILREKDFEE